MTTQSRTLTRYLQMDAQPDADRTEALLNLLHAQTGIREAMITNGRLKIVYDPLQMRLDYLLKLLEQQGISLAGGWLQSCRLAWYQYQDEAVCENAGAPPPACCNRPPRPR